MKWDEFECNEKKLIIILNTYFLTLIQYFLQFSL